MTPTADLFSVSPLEEIVINLLPVPPHPATTFDDVAFRAALARSVSLLPEEKVTILRRVPELTQNQIDQILAILKDEAATFADLVERTNAATVDDAEAARRRAAFRVHEGGRT